LLYIEKEKGGWGEKERRKKRISLFFGG